VNGVRSVMSLSEKIEIRRGERKLIADLYRTNRRVLRIEVEPSGQVIVFAPIDASTEDVERRAQRKGPWIFREISRIANRPSVTPDRHFISGETHLLLGRQYRLSIEQNDDAQVQIHGSRLRILARRPDDHAHCRRLLVAFYALTARAIFAERLEAMIPPFIRKGMQRPSLVVRQMSKRWGSYTATGRIVLNVDLVRASPVLIDYVICHELAHAFYPDHGKDWRSLFDAIMPDWEIRKANLEALLR